LCFGDRVTVLNVRFFGTEGVNHQNFKKSAILPPPISGWLPKLEILATPLGMRKLISVIYTKHPSESFFAPSWPDGEFESDMEE
jgi:hypothetical protein